MCYVFPLLCFILSCSWLYRQRVQLRYICAYIGPRLSVRVKNLRFEKHDDDQNFTWNITMRKQVALAHWFHCQQSHLFWCVVSCCAILEAKKPVWNGEYTRKAVASQNGSTLASWAPTALTTYRLYVLQGGGLPSLHVMVAQHQHADVCHAASHCACLDLTGLAEITLESLQLYFRLGALK